MEKRILGKTLEKLSIVGFGGIVASLETQKEANRFVDYAIDKGINYFDVAPTYNDAEDKLGSAIKGKRNNLFLACKTENRTKEGSKLSLHQSLKKLNTDYFDLYQLHAMTTLEDVEMVFSKDGAMETFLEAKKEGLINHIGFSAHSEEAALALLDRFEFDSILFPINWVSILNGGFGVNVIKKAEEKGIGILSLKSMAKTSLLKNEVNKYPKAWYEALDEKDLSKLAFKFALSKNITAAIPPGDIEHLRWAIEEAHNFKPITLEEIEKLRLIAKEIKPLFPL